MLHCDEKPRDQCRHAVAVVGVRFAPPALERHARPGAIEHLAQRDRATVTEKRIGRDILCNVPDLEVAINEYIALRNAKPNPFSWTTKASNFLCKVTRARAAWNASISNGRTTAIRSSDEQALAFGAPILLCAHISTPGKISYQNPPYATLKDVSLIGVGIDIYSVRDGSDRLAYIRMNWAFARFRSNTSLPVRDTPAA